MLSETEIEEQQAILHYELWKMHEAQTCQVEKKASQVSMAEEHRQKALVLYQKLYEKTPNFEYKKRIEKLSE